MDAQMLERIQDAVLGAMIATADFRGEGLAKLSAEDFGLQGGRREIFSAIRALHFAGAPISDLTLIHELGEDYAAAVAAAIEAAPEDPAYYCEMLQENTQLHRIQMAAFQVSCASELDRAQELLDALNKVAVRKTRLRAVDAETAARDFLNRIASEVKPKYLPWGIKQLDDNITAELGDFVGVGGYSSSGKTLLSLQFAVRMAKQYRVGYYSLETSVGKLTDRLISHLAQVPLPHIKRREFTEEDKAAIGTATSQMARLTLDLVPASGMTVQDVRAAALGSRHQIIFIDYLQLVRSSGQTRYEEVTNTSMALHELAQSHGITVVALSQLSRPEKNGGKPRPPDMSSFRESGQIEQDLDVAMLLYPADPNDNNSNRVLKLGKNKDGPRTRMELEFHGRVQTLKPLPPSYYQEMKRVKSEIREDERLAAERSSAFKELPEAEQTELPF